MCESPYWEFYNILQSFDEKVANVSLAFELMMDGGLPQPKVTDIVQSKSDYDGNNIIMPQRWQFTSLQKKSSRSESYNYRKLIVMWEGTYFFAHIFCPFKVILLSLFPQPLAGATRRHCQLGLEVHIEGALQPLHQVQASQLDDRPPSHPKAPSNLGIKLLTNISWIWDICTFQWSCL